MDDPSPIRMYNYFLGGTHNVPVDHHAAEQVQALYEVVHRNNPAARVVYVDSDPGVVLMVSVGVDTQLGGGRLAPRAR